VLVSEADNVRVWHLKSAPGDGSRFTGMILDYFWTTPPPNRKRARLLFKRRGSSNVYIILARRGISATAKLSYFVHAIEKRRASGTSFCVTVESWGRQ